MTKDDYGIYIIGIVFMLGIWILIIYGISQHKECEKHVRYEQQECDKCIKKSDNGKYCEESIKSTCNIPIYDEEYEYCRNW